MMRRSLLAALCAAVVSPAIAQRVAQRKVRIGYLGLAATGPEWEATIKDALRRAGYEEGRNLSIDWRYADGSLERLSAQAAELVRMKVDVIVAMTNDATLAARRATRTIPIVMMFGALPVEAGIVESLARPGGNVTGTGWNSPETAGKKVQFLKEVAPALRQLAVLWNPSFPALRVYGEVTERAAAAVGLSVRFFDAERVEDIGPALRRLADARPDLLYAMTDPLLWLRHQEIIAFTRERKLLSLGSWPYWVRAGGLFYYGPELGHLTERTVAYVDRVLRGAKPAALPIELPAKYEFVVNREAARAIGYTPPAALLARADRVIG